MTQHISDQYSDQDLMEQLTLKHMFSLEVLNWPVFRLIIQSTLPQAPGDISDAITCACPRGYDKTSTFNLILNQTTSSDVLAGKYI